MSGVEAAIAIARERKGAAYAPHVVECFCQHAAQLMAGLDQEPSWDVVLSSEPGHSFADLVRKESQMSKTIRQSVTFKTTPHQVYEALMDSRKHAKFTGDAASISRKVGGKIMAYGGYITGTNVELAPDERMVQTWHAADWPEGHESKVIFSLKPVEGGTRLTFTHSGVPDDQVESIQQGWIEHYWTPMKAMLEK